jgi:two-component system chemotaxis sensor kinase CheA
LLERARAQSPFVVVEGDDGRLALAVDRLLGQEEVVLKALSRPLDLVPGLAGVTILGNGQPVFILDVARLVTRRDGSARPPGGRAA